MQCGTQLFPCLKFTRPSSCLAYAQKCSGPNQSLLHVLNNCSVARDSRRYKVRHDSILRAITETVRHNISSAATVTADISDTYEFPHHIIPTDLRPDLVWWDEAHKSITLVELTVCFETNFDRRKTAKYLHLCFGSPHDQSNTPFLERHDHHYSQSMYRGHVSLTT